MIFNSIDFLLFFPIVYGLYLVSPFRIQNLLLLAASYFFYGYWDWRYLSLLIISTVIDYFASLGIEKYRHIDFRRKVFLATSIVSNLGILGFFKYYNFFTKSAREALSSLGWSVNPVVLEYALPLGISFYTFQTMSYTIDVYRNQLKPERSFLNFALYVTFFPQLVAGPIERATRLLPQVVTPRVITMVEVQRGAFLILLGYFKKVFVADNLSYLVDPVFVNRDSSGFEVFVACWAFFFQIYGDFAGYSDIARGLAKLMGFELMRNFNLPIFSTNMVELWKRWHISFMTWLRDYLYHPLGGNRVSELRQQINNVFVFFISGLWHGANWTFIVWGVYSGVLTSLYRFLQPKLPVLPGDNVFIIKKFKNFLKIFFTVGLFALSAVFFRGQEVSLSFLFLKKIFTSFGLIQPDLIFKLLKNVTLLLAIEYFQEKTSDEYAIFRLPSWARGLLYAVMFYAVVILGNFNKNEFIYFVF